LLLNERVRDKKTKVDSQGKRQHQYEGRKGRKAGYTKNRNLWKNRRLRWQGEKDVIPEHRISGGTEVKQNYWIRSQEQRVLRLIVISEMSQQKVGLKQERLENHFRRLRE